MSDDHTKNINQPSTSQEELIAELQLLLEQSNRSLRNSHDRLRTIMHSIPLGLFIATKDGVIRSASPACEAMFRCELSEFFGRDFDEMFYSDSAKEQGPLVSRLSELQELRARRADGSEFDATVTVKTFAGSEAGLLVVVEDVTTQREAERLRQEFMNMITHDLRAPLSATKAFLDVVKEGLYDTRPDALKQRATVAASEMMRLIKMINNLLNLHKYEAGHLKLGITNTSIGTVISRSLDSMASLSQSNGVELEAPQTNEDLPVRADADYIVQVLINLISNAIKFSPKGSTVTVSVEDMDLFVKVAVRDRGRGMPKEFEKRIFNRFEQMLLSDASVQGGSGLGLAISKAIVEEHGGSIGAQGDLEPGSLFWFTLPKASPDADDKDKT